MQKSTVVVMPNSEAAGSVVAEQTGMQVVVTQGGHLPIGGWIRAGDHIMIVRRHQKSRAERETRAVCDLVFERSRSVWGAVRRAVQPGTRTERMDSGTWRELMRSAFDDAVAVGRVRQDGETARAYVPALPSWAGVVVGKRGSGKSSVINAMLVEWRNAILGNAYEPGRKPGLVVCDLHGDFLARVRDRDGRQRPSLAGCLEEEPVVFRPGELTCRGREIPASLLVKSLPDLTASQKRWIQLYVQGDDDYEKIEVLLRDEARWAREFEELTVGGELPRPIQESLVVLRSKFAGLLKPPLFTKSGESTWQVFREHVRAGRTVIVDVGQWPPVQRDLVVVLILRTLKYEQFAAQRRGERLQEILVVVEEAHSLAGATKEFISYYLEARKLLLGIILVSQSLGHFDTQILDNATHAVLLRSEGADAARAQRRWPELRAVAGEMLTLRAGSGYFVSDGVAWPMEFAEPKIRRDVAY